MFLILEPYDESNDTSMPGVALLVTPATDEAIRNLQGPRSSNARVSEEAGIQKVSKLATELLGTLQSSSHQI
jgi:hypothetical protein